MGLLEKDGAAQTSTDTSEEFRTILYSIGDAVITTDRAGQVRRMNGVAEQLTGWAEAEAHGKPCAQIFHIVNEETRTEVENPIERVLREGQVVGLANHTLLIARDGTERPINDSGAPIRDKAGEISGVVLIFRDQSAERAAQCALLESERTLGTLMSNLPGMAYRCRNDQDWTMEFVSEGALALTGYTCEEITLQCQVTYASLIHEDDRARVWDCVQAGVNGHKPFELEYRIRTAGGQEKWVWERGRGIFSPTGALTSLEGFISDITERKRAEEASRRSEEGFRGAFQYSAIGMANISPEGKWLKVNASLCAIVGYSEDELLAMTFQDITHPDDLDIDLNYVHQMLAGEIESYSMEKRYFHKDRRIVWVLLAVSLVKDRDGVPLYFVSQIEDITERKHAEEALRRSEAMLAKSQEIAHVGSWELDTVNNRLTWSGEVYKIFGMSPLEFAATYEAFLSAVHPDDRAAVSAAYDESVREGKNGYEMEHRIIRKDTGEIRIVHEKCLHVRDTTGRIIGSLGMVQDITERKRLEEALEQRLVALTRPLDQPEGIAFDDLFDLATIQRIQDEFAAATGVASIITHPDGTPITRPSNFCRLCEGIIRRTEMGRLNCYRSDACLGRHHPDGPIIQPCMSGGLWDAGASITVGDRHIANWLIGQVRDETQSEEKMREYARMIGADETTVLEAFREVPAMSYVRFKQIAQALFTLASQLSTTAYQNIQQARFIHERKQAEDALRVSEERFRSYFELPLIGIALTASDKRWLEVNDRLCEILGYSREELLRMTWAQITHPADLQSNLEKFKRVQTGQSEGYSLEKRFIRKDGRTIHVDMSVRCIRKTNGAIDYFVSIFQDITERKQAEEALQARESLLRAVIDNVPFEFWARDMEGRCILENAPLVNHWGSLLGKRFEEGDLSPEVLAIWMDNNKRAMNGETVDGEVEYSVGGEMRTYQNIIAPIRMGDSIQGVLGLNIDITERKQMENNLKEADRRKDEFLAMLAHELRNPLEPIRCSVHIMRQLAPNMPTLSRQQDMIDRQVTHMARLVDDLLDVSRITRGTIRLKRDRLDLREVVGNAIETCMPRVSQHELQLHYQGPPDPIWVEGDFTRLEQILSNLLGNAVKFNEAGGKIDVTLGVEAMGRENPTLMATLRVRDTGVGIVPEMLPRIFELFVQADQSLDRARGGLGIGLTMVKRLVEMHGGRIEARSAGIGQGSEFIIQLPLSFADQPFLEQQSPEPLTDHKARVLVVEDIPDAAQSMADLLTLWGHEVAIAFNGSQAVEVARRFQPTIVLLDIGLPGENGYQVARRLRQEVGLETTKLIAITGYGRDEDYNQSKDAGFSLHLTKPVDLKVLREIL